MAQPRSSRDPSPLDVHGNVTAEIAFHDVVVIDDLADLHDLRLRSTADAPLRRDGDLGANLPGEGIADAWIYVRATSTRLLVGMFSLQFGPRSRLLVHG